MKMISKDLEIPRAGHGADEIVTVAYSKACSSPVLAEEKENRTRDLPFNAEKTRPSYLKRSVRSAWVFAICIGISTMIAILIVYYTSPKHPETTCRFILKSEALNTIREDSHPRSINVSDLNGDGLLDMVVSNSGTDNIGILLQSSERTFDEQVPYSTGLRSSPYAVTVADFDGDQRLDIAVANFGTHNVGIFLGTGNGTFRTQRTFSTKSSRPRWLAAGDFNNDELIDLAVVNGGTNDIGIFIGDGRGSLTHWRTFSTGFDSLPHSLAVADLNHDSQLDVVVANSGTRNVGIFLGYGNGSLMAQTIVSVDSSSSPSWVSLVDVNNDTHTDIVVACPNTNTVVVWRGFGNGLFSAPTNYSTGSNSASYSIVIGDFNDDTKLDIVAAAYGTSSLVVLFGRGNGSFADVATFYTSKDSNPYAIGAGHFNNDTRLDVAVVNYDFNYVDIVLTSRNYSFTSPTNYPTIGERSRPNAIAVADLNNDTEPDLIVMNYRSNILEIFLGTANGTFVHHYSVATEPESDPEEDAESGANGGNYGTGGDRVTFTSAATDLGPVSIAIGDWDNNSRVDIVVASYASDYVNVFLGLPDGTLSTPKIYPTFISSGPCAVLIADLNGDKQQDIAAALYLSNQIVIFFGNGRGDISDSTLLFLSAKSRPVWIGTADFNNDQHADLAVLNNYNGDVGVFFGSASGTFSYRVVFPAGTGASPNTAIISDFNADGRMDLVVNIYYNRAFEVLLNSGNGTFVSQTRYSVGSLSRPSSSTLGDWNNDQRLDLIVSSCNTSSILVFLGNGDGTFRRGQPHFTGNNTCPLSSAGGDFNHDGLLDLAVTNGKTKQIIVFPGYTFMNGLRHATYSTGSASHPRGLALGPVTTKGHLDVLMANFGLGQLSILEGFGNGTFLAAAMFSTGALSFPTSVAVADLNKDAKVDLVVANSLSGNIGIFYGLANRTFTSQRTYWPSGSFSPQALLCADFNHDEKIDIAIVSSGSGSVSILLKSDTVVFRDDQKYPTGTSSYPHAVAVGDFNNDASPDFVTVNRGSASISIFLGSPNGSFAGPIPYSAGIDSPSYAVLVGHFNNDTSLDIVVSHYWLNQISLFRGRGNGTFFRFGTYETSASCLPIGLAMGDLNDDRRLDVVAVCESGSISIFLGKTDGHFTTGASFRPNNVGSFLYAAVADFDNDNCSDIAVTDTVTSGIVLFRGLGDGTFVDAGSYSTGTASRPRPIATADLNKDGTMDIVVGNSGSDTISVFLGYGNGSFSRGVPYRVENGSTSYGLVIRDLNNDEQLDVAVAGYGNNKVSVLLGLINGTFFDALTFSTGEYSQPSFLAVADFNNDTRLDLVVAESGVHRAGVYLGSADQDFLFAPSYSLTSISQPTSIAAADLNNDTHLDVIVADNTTDNVVVLFGSGIGTFTRADFYPTGNTSRPCSVAVADVNNDTQLDFVVANSNSDSVTVFLSNGTGIFDNRVSYSTGFRSKPSAVALLDFDNDTRLDIAVANYESSNVIVFFGFGNGSFSTPLNFSTGFGSHPFGLAVGDVNNDQLTDIVVTNNGYGNVGILMKTC